MTFAEQLMNAATACYERDEPHAAHICRTLAASVAAQWAVESSDPNNDWLRAAVTLSGEEC